MAAVETRCLVVLHGHELATSHDIAAASTRHVLGWVNSPTCSVWPWPWWQSDNAPVTTKWTVD